LSERPADARLADERAEERLDVERPDDERLEEERLEAARLEARPPLDARFAFGLAAERFREPPVDFEPPDLVAI
jgi:hypothetical protein